MKDCRKRKKKKKRSVRQDSNPWLLDHGSCARPLCHNRCPSASVLIIFENFLRVEQDGMRRRRLPGEDNGERWICIETFLFILLLLSRPSFLLSLSLSLSLFLTLLVNLVHLWSIRQGTKESAIRGKRVFSENKTVINGQNKTNKNILPAWKSIFRQSLSSFRNYIFSAFYFLGTGKGTTVI